MHGDRRCTAVHGRAAARSAQPDERELHEVDEKLQPCRDRVFLAFCDDGGHPHRYVLRTGALGGVRRVPDASPGSAQLAFEPFSFDAPGRPVAWEPTSIVYAGPVPSLCELGVSLHPMRSFLGRHQVLVCSPRDLSASLPAPLGEFRTTPAHHARQHGEDEMIPKFSQSVRNRSTAASVVGAVREQREAAWRAANRTQAARRSGR